MPLLAVYGCGARISRALTRARIVRSVAWLRESRGMSCLIARRIGSPASRPIRGRANGSLLDER